MERDNCWLTQKFSNSNPTRRASDRNTLMAAAMVRVSVCVCDVCVCACGVCMGCMSVVYAGECIKAAETKWHQRDARRTPGRTYDPLAMHVVPRLPRKRAETK